MTDQRKREAEKSLELQNSPEATNSLVKEKIRAGEVESTTIYCILLKKNEYYQIEDDDTYWHTAKVALEASRWESLKDCKEFLDELLDNCKSLKKTACIVEFQAIYTQVRVYNKKTLDKALIQEQIKKLEEDLKKLNTD